MSGPRFILTVFAVLAVAGCKVEITVPAGGRVVTASGTNQCYNGQTCVVDVTDIFFDETFSAQPNNGYEFAGWKKQWKGLCGGKNTPCRLFTSGFEGNEKLMAILRSDDSFYLEPVFTKVLSGSYDAEYWKQLVEELDSGEYTSDSKIYSRLPDVANCDPGSLTGTAKNRALEVLNEVRSLHGLPDVQYDSFYDAEVQSASLVQRANNYINHHPAQNDRCYTALAGSGSSSSNLHLSSSSDNGDPAGNILSWIQDKNNVSTFMAAGHRRWSLYPALGYISYGQVKGASAQKVFRFGMESGEPAPPDLDFVAFPYQAYPYILVEKGGKTAPWSLSMVPYGNMSNTFDYFVDAEVKVKEKSTGKQLSVSNLYSDTKGFGLHNFLSWLVDDYDYDTEYLVEIDNIQLPGGERRSVKYSVYLDYYNLFDVMEPLEAGDTKNGNKLQGSFLTNNDKDSYTVGLAGKTVFKGDSRFSNQAFFILLYDDRKRLIKSSDATFQEVLDPGEYTVVASLCDGDGLCYQNVKNYTISIQ